MLKFSSRLGAGYSIDKLKFLQLYQETKKQVICKDLILSAFRKCGYKPWNSSLILDSLPGQALKSKVKAIFEHSTGENANQANTRTNAPIEAIVNKRYKSIIPPTPKHPNRVDELLAQALEDDAIDPIVCKLGKSLKKIMADVVITSAENEELAFTLASRAKKKPSTSS